MAVKDMQTFLDNPNAKLAIRKALANITGVPSEYIDVDVVAEAKRLRARMLSQSGNLLVTYAIVVPSDAPDTVYVTGVEVGEKLLASNLDHVQIAVSTSIENVFGSELLVSIESVIIPNVIENSLPVPVPSTPTPAPPTATPSTETPASPTPTPAPPTPALSTPTPAPPTPSPPTLATASPSSAPTSLPTQVSPTPAPSPHNLSPTPNPPTSALPTPGPPTTGLPTSTDTTTSTTEGSGLQADEDLRSCASRVPGVVTLCIVALLMITP